MAQGGYDNSIGESHKSAQGSTSEDWAAWWDYMRTYWIDTGNLLNGYATINYPPGRSAPEAPCSS